MAVVGWSQVHITEPLDLELDSANPRIDVPADATQEQIRIQLTKHEDVVGLARSIVSFGGLMPGERILLLRNGPAYVVLEGNRRVCAVQMLLNPSLVPPSIPSFPRATSQVLVGALSSIDADVAPNREAAEAVLTKRHTEPAIRSWSTVAKLRRVWRLVESGIATEKVATRLGAQARTVRRYVREYRMLNLVKQLPVWSADERDKLDDERLQVTTYFRFFSLEDAKGRLHISFDEDERLVSDLPDDLLNAFLESTARTLLLKQGGVKAGSRMPVDDVLKRCDQYGRLATIQEGIKSVRETDKTQYSSRGVAETTGPTSQVKTSIASTGAGPRGSTPASPKPPTFFENLSISVQDPILEQIVYEIRLVQHFRMPYAATCLLRALLEASLRYQLQKTGAWTQLMKESRRDPSLDVMIQFAANSASNVFKEKRAADVLNAFRQSGHKEVFDLVVHAQWMHANPQTLVQAASLLRQLIVYILNDERRGELSATASQ